MKLFSSSVFVGATSLMLFTGCVKTATNSGSAQKAPQMQTASGQTTLEGKWDYTMSNPEQAPFSGVFVVQRGGSAGYTGWISVSTIDFEAQTNITKAEIQGQNFTYMGEVQTRIGSFPFELTGTIKGNTMTGQNKVKTEDGPVIFKVTATRQ